MKEFIYKQVVKHLRYVRPSGPNNIGGPCPFHKGGEEKKPSFYVNTKTGLYYCHACNVKGTFSDFLRLMGVPNYIINTQLELEEEYQKSIPVKLKKIPHRDFRKGEYFVDEAILGIFNKCPTGLLTAGFDKQLLQQLEIGFDNDEMRITFPIRDLYGRLVGISGRTVIDEFPRYKVYKAHNYQKYESEPGQIVNYDYDIKNHNFLWNMHRIYHEALSGEIDTIIIVEGYKACIWLIQHGYPNTVALQGSKLSKIQELILSDLDCTFILLLDNNEAGKKGALETGRRLKACGFKVKACTYPEHYDENAQPDNLTQPELIGVIDAAINWHTWRRQCHHHLQDINPH